MLPEIPPEELSAGLDRAVMEVLAEVGIEAPPVDALLVARRLGITLAEDDRQRCRARYVRLSGHRGGPPGATILLRPEVRPERRQWAVAHEIGEHVARRVFAALAVDPREAPPGAREMVANHLAGRLLLPGAWFAGDATGCGWDLLHLKRHYSTASHEMIARRMLDFEPPIIVTVFDHTLVTFRRSNVPGNIPPLLSAERNCWLRAHDQNVPCRTSEGPWAVHAWPVHEEGWKREILRTEVAEELIAAE